jgi:hypothetical protein
VTGKPALEAAGVADRRTYGVWATFGGFSTPISRVP